MQKYLYSYTYFCFASISLLFVCSVFCGWRGSWPLKNHTYSKVLKRKHKKKTEFVLLIFLRTLQKCWLTAVTVAVIVVALLAVGAVQWAGTVVSIAECQQQYISVCLLVQLFVFFSLLSNCRVKSVRSICFIQVLFKKLPTK